jgi:hypothetical protein
MSGRGTTKAGTYGGRQFRQRAIKKKQENIEREREFRKELRKAQKPKTLRDPKSIKPGVGALAYEDVQGNLQHLARLSEEKARDIQLAVNTMPLRQDPRYIMEIRERLEQQRQERLGINPEDRDDGVDNADVVNALHGDPELAGFEIAPDEADTEDPTPHAEAPEFVGDADKDEGELQYGASGMAQPDRVEKPDWMDGGEPPAEMTEPLMGEALDDLAGELMDMSVQDEVGDLADQMAQTEITEIDEPMDADTDTDEEVERFARDLDRAGEGRIKFNQKAKWTEGGLTDRTEAMKEMTASLREKRAVGPSSREPKPHKWSQAGPRPEGTLPRDIFGEEAGEDPRIAEQDPEWQAHIRETGALSGHPEGLPTPMEEEVEFEGFESGKGRKIPKGFIRGLAPTSKHDTGHRIDAFKRDKKGNLKVGAKGLAFTDEYKKLQEGRIMDLRPGLPGKDVGANDPAIDFTGGKRSRAIPSGKKQEEYKERLGYGDIKPSERPLLEKDKRTGEWTQVMGPIRHPKTRKVLRRLLPEDKTDPRDKKDKTYKQHKSGRYATGDEILEPKTFSSAGRKKPIEEVWGLAQKGMSRDETGETDRQYIRTAEGKLVKAPGFEYQAPHRDPWEGSRAVAKEPGKRATKKGFHGIKAGTEHAGMGEAEVKSKLYRKTAREKDPDYVPSDQKGAQAGFQYGAGVSQWDKKGKPAVLENVGGHSGMGAGAKVQLTSDDFAEAPSDTGISAEELEALKGFERKPSSKLVPAFPGAQDIVAPRSTIDPKTGASRSIIDPVMTDLKAGRPSKWMAKGRTPQLFHETMLRKERERPEMSEEQAEALIQQYENLPRSQGGALPNSLLEGVLAEERADPTSLMMDYSNEVEDDMDELAQEMEDFLMEEPGKSDLTEEESYRKMREIEYEDHGVPMEANDFDRNAYLNKKFGTKFAPTWEGHIRDPRG